MRFTALCSILFASVGSGQVKYTISTLAAGESAHLWGPSGIAVGPSGDIFIADTEMNRVLQVTRSGLLSTVAGKGKAILRMEGSGPPPQFSGDGGPATSADLDRPTGVAVDAQGNIYISDQLNNRIRKVTPDGRIQTIAGTGETGYGGDNGPALAAKLAHPMGIAVDGNGNVYVADRENNRIREISVDGTIRTVIGNGVRGQSENGPALSISLSFPHGVAIDAKGVLYVADTFNHRIRRLDADGVVRVVAGTGNQEFIGDGGPALQAGLGAPDSLAVDADSNIYIADRANWRLRKITKDGTIQTVAGDHGSGFYGDGGPALLAPVFPTSVAVSLEGIVYLTDHNRVRLLTPDQK